MTLEAPVAAVACVTAVVGSILAVLDPSVTNIVLAVIATIGLITPLWFKHRIDMLNIKQKEHDAKIQEVIKTSDGIKDALVKATAAASLAEGKAAGVAQAESKAATIAAATSVGVAAGVAKEKEAESNRKMTPPVTTTAVE